METTTSTTRTPDGRTLCIESAGDPDGPTVLVHHGTPGGRLLGRLWIEDAERLGIRLVSYDRPGYGGSSSSVGRTVADCAADVEVIAESLGAERIAVWGISGGGPHALACAALLPDLVVAVASLASLAPYGDPDLDYFEGMGQENVDDITLYLDDPVAARRKSEADRSALLETTPEEVAQSFATLLSPEDAAVVNGEFASFLLRSMQDGIEPGDQGWWDDGCASLGPWGFEFSDISVPVQLWHGRQDHFVPFGHGQWLAERIPGVDARLSETDGHLTLLERLPVIHEWLLAHFSSPKPASGA